MSNQAEWQNHFKSAITGIASSLSLEEVLEQGFISETDYLHWACEHYGLAIINDSFFNNTEMQTQIWNKWKDKYPWSKKCLPIADWDGHIIVASAYEPTTLPPEFSGICFFATSATLKKIWQSYQPQIPKIESVLAIKAMPEGLSFENLKSNVAEDSASNILLNAEEEVDLSAKSSEESAEEFQTPEGLGLDLNIKSMSQLSKTGDTPIENKEKVILQPLASPIIQEQAPIIQKPPSIMQESVPSIKEAQISVELSWLEQLQNKNTSAFKQIGTELFNTMSTFYEHSMVLSYHEDSTTMTTVLWDQKFPNDVKKKKYQLINPSIFKIVKNSEKPFHGQPHLNEFNDTFFEDWHANSPDHVTITPILIEGRVIGMIYCSGAKSANSNQALRFAVNKTQEWLDSLMKKLNQQAA